MTLSCAFPLFSCASVACSNCFTDHTHLCRRFVICTAQQVPAKARPAAAAAAAAAAGPASGRKRKRVDEDKKDDEAPPKPKEWSRYTAAEYDALPLEPWAKEFTAGERWQTAQLMRDLWRDELVEWGITKKSMDRPRQIACVGAFLYSSCSPCTPNKANRLWPYNANRLWGRWSYCKVEENMHIIRTLIARGVPSEGMLIQALAAKHPQTVKALLNLSRTNPQQVPVNAEIDGITALLRAIMWRSVPFVATLSAVTSRDVLNNCFNGRCGSASALQCICHVLIKGPNSPGVPYDPRDDTDIYARMACEVLKRADDDGSGVCLKPSRPIFRELSAAPGVLKRNAEGHPPHVTKDLLRQLSVIAEAVYAAAKRQANYRIGVVPAIVEALVKTSISGFSNVLSTMIAAHVLYPDDSKSA